MAEQNKAALLSNLPPEVLDHVFSFLRFHNIAAFRRVCRLFNDVGRRRLNREAARILAELDQLLHGFKYEVLPRSLTLREEHPLWKRYQCVKNFRQLFVDVGNLFAQHPIRARCCFVAGKLLDFAGRLILRITYPYNMTRDELLHTLTEDVYFYLKYQTWDPEVNMENCYEDSIPEFDHVDCWMVDYLAVDYKLLRRLRRILSRPSRRQWKKISVGRKLKALRRRIRSLTRAKKRIARMNRGLWRRNRDLEQRVKRLKIRNDSEWTDYESETETVHYDIEIRPDRPTAYIRIIKLPN